MAEPADPLGAGVALALLLVVTGVLVARVVRTTPGPGGQRVAARRVPVDVERDFTTDERRRERAYHRSLRAPGWAGSILSTLLVLALGSTGLGAALVERAGRLLGGGWVAQVLLGGLALLLLGRLLGLPFAAWSQRVRRAYGLSTQTWSAWLLDVGKSTAVGAVLLLPALLGLVGLARAYPLWWFVPVGAGGAVLVVALSFLSPLLFEPLFNRFRPMPAGEQRSRLLELAHRDGVAVEDVLVADASRRTTALNAYVSGLGASRRIVVYDTLLDAAPSTEVEVVVAHELGHTAERDVVVGTALGAVGVAAGAAALALVLGWQPLLERAGADGPGDPRVLALLAAVAAVAGLLTQPFQLLLSRRIEARADLHALRLTHDPVTFAAMMRRLAVRGLARLEPNPFVLVWSTSHPSVPTRIALARTVARAHGWPEPADLAGSGAGPPSVPDEPAAPLR